MGLLESSYLDIINTVISGSIPLIILFFGYRIEQQRKKKNKQENNDINRIERKYEPHVQFEFGLQNGHYVAEVSMLLHNKGLVRTVIKDQHLKFLGIQKNTEIKLSENENQDQKEDKNSISKSVVSVTFLI